VLWHGQALEKSAAVVEGDRQALKRFLAMFPAPQPAPRTAA
jgi:hypothetical protein